MTEIDQFESVFRAADKPVFHYKKWEVQSVLVISDLDESQLSTFRKHVNQFLSLCTANDSLQIKVVGGDQSRSIPQLLSLIESNTPDLIVAYRNLYTPVSDHPYSLGTHLDVMTQASEVPILVVPDPRENDLGESLASLTQVMAITDHLAGDDTLVSRAVSMTPEDQTLWLTHVEDDATLQRYVKTISKISQIDTEVAEKEITSRLLKEPRDFIESCQQKLQEADVHCVIQQEVTLGHHLSVYKDLIKRHEIGLLVLNTKDEDQLAMHGTAYPLTVELRDTPILLL